MKFLEIQGLRAIAVLAVIAYHLNSQIFTIGYIGVDIFFVISGFLITHLLMKETDLRLTNIKSFYIKRIKRIYPAMTLVVLVSTLIGFIFLRGEDLAKMGLQGTLALLGIVNFYFFSKTEVYFAESSFVQPFLHLWSLAVEIQFYLFWPLLLLLILGLSHQVRVFLIFLMGLFSYFVFSNTEFFSENAVFYLLTSRFWQFSLGILLALIHFKSNKLTKSKIYKFMDAFLPLILITAFISQMFIVLNSEFIYWTILISAVLVIFNSKTLASSYSILKSKPFTYVGEISYSLYLWHWPVLYFFNNVSFLPKNEINLYTVTLTAILAVITNIFWENKFRSKNKYISNTKKNIIPVSILATFMVLFVSQSDKITSIRFSELKNLQANSDSKEGYSIKEIGCLSDYNETWEVWEEYCLPNFDNKDKPLIVTWGDSHVPAIADALEIEDTENYFSHARASTTSCPPILGLADSVSPNSECKDNNNYVWKYIKNNVPHTLILVARWPIYANPQWYESGLRDLQITIAEAQKLGIKKVVLISSNPEWNESLPELLWKYQISSGEVPETLDNPTYYNLRDINFNLEEMASAAGIVYIDLLKMLCKENQCQTYYLEEDFYPVNFDGDHLTVYVGRRIVREFGLLDILK